MSSQQRGVETNRPRRSARLTARWVGVVLCLLVLGWLVRRAVAPAFGVDETWARVKREGTLRVGMDASYPPFENIDDGGGFTGLDVDLAFALADRWSATPRFVNVHFDGLYDALRAEKFDLIISALPYDRTLTRDVLYSRSYFNAGQVLLVQIVDESVGGVDDLEGKRIAVELGAEGHQLARQLARDRGWALEILPVRESEQAVRLVTLGEADALICDRVAAYGYLGRHPELRIAGDPLTDEPYVIATRLSAVTLMGEINAALEAWGVDGTLDMIKSRWLGGDDSRPESGS